MCPVCIARAAVMVAGAASSGGILAVCVGTLKKLFTFSDPDRIRKGERTWQQARRKKMDTTKGLLR